MANAIFADTSTNTRKYVAPSVLGETAMAAIEKNPQGGQTEKKEEEQEEKKKRGGGGGGGNRKEETDKEETPIEPQTPAEEGKETVHVPVDFFRPVLAESDF